MKNKQTQTDDYLPLGLKILASVAWRIFLVCGLIFATFWALSQITIIVVPILIALLISSLLLPVVNWLVAKNIFRVAAVIISIIGLLIIVGGLFTLIWQQLNSNLSLITDKTVGGISELQLWLLEGPLKLTSEEINKYFGEVTKFLQNNISSLLSTVVSATNTITKMFMGTILVLFSTFFFLLDGKKIWNWCLQFFPKNLHEKIYQGFSEGWNNVSKYFRVQILVAFIDGLGIGLGALILGVPLSLPLGILVFLGSFVPILGAVITGAVAVLIALVYNGWFVAWLMLAIVLLVQQVESHLLQPLIVGKAVSIHPLAIMLVVTAATFIFGIPGALFAVPITAFLHSVVNYFLKNQSHSL